MLEPVEQRNRELCQSGVGWLGDCQRSGVAGPGTLKSLGGSFAQGLSSHQIPVDIIQTWDTTLFVSYGNILLTILSYCIYALSTM
jgi:hypothetical protein